MKDDLVRVESAVSATASGNLTWGLWPHECAIAMGYAGRRNPLGFYVVRYLSNTPNTAAMWGVVLVLANEMQKRGVPADGIKEAAMQAFEFWRDSRCPSCGGRGVSGIEQGLCVTCHGSGQRSVPQSPDSMKIGIGCLREAESMMEGQLAAKLKRS